MSFWRNIFIKPDDLIFTQICHAKNMALITHDKDFSELGVEILTTNEKLIDAGRE